MTYQEVETDIWKPVNPNDEVAGIFIKSESEVGANKSMLYHLEVDGKPVAVWGSTVLDTKMVAIKSGDKIKIVYEGLGEAKAGHNAPKKFKVYVDRP